MLTLIISRLGKHQFATRKTVIRIKERTNSQRGTHQFATRNASIRARNALADGDITE